jgi:hypothetical protein
MLKKSVSTEKAEVQAKVEVKIKERQLLAQP